MSAPSDIRPDVGPEAYPAPMATPAGTGSHNPFPVAPADVPIAAVRAVKRTLLRSTDPDIGDPMDDELARLVVAVVIAVLHPDGMPVAPETDGAHR